MPHHIKPHGVIAPASVDESGKLSGFVHSFDTGGAVDGPGMRFVLFVRAVNFNVCIATTPTLGKCTMAK